DGGLFSNTPLAYMVVHYPRRSRLILQVDVFPAHGRVPTNLAEVTERDKDVRYSSCTRLTTTDEIDKRFLVDGTRCRNRERSMRAGTKLAVLGPPRTGKLRAWNLRRPTTMVALARATSWRSVARTDSVLMPAALVVANAECQRNGNPIGLFAR